MSRGVEQLQRYGQQMMFGGMPLLGVLGRRRTLDGELLLDLAVLGQRLRSGNCMA